MKKETIWHDEAVKVRWITSITGSLIKMTEELNQQTNSPQTKPFDGTSLKQDGQNASLSDGGKDKTADILKEHDKEYFEMFEGCEKYLGSYMDYPKEFENCSDKIIKENAYNVDILCGDKEFVYIAKKKLEQKKRDMQMESYFIKNVLKKQKEILLMVNYPLKNKKTHLNSSNPSYFYEITR